MGDCTSLCYVTVGYVKIKSGRELQPGSKDGVMGRSN